MKQELAGIVGGAGNTVAAGNLAREYLQARILLALQETGAFVPLAFQGGTALRFLYDLPRFSESLDFALERPGRGEFELEDACGRITSRLRREGYAVHATPRAGEPVARATVAFPGLPHELGLSPHPDQVLRIRLEVDSRPPVGATLETTIVRRHVLLNLQHHDRASLLAGKLHAILHRSWAKGRDLFDLFWYLSDRRWPGPNLELLNNALMQTHWEGAGLDEDSWRPAVRERVAALDWAAAGRDVAPFLEAGPETSLFQRENLLKLLR